MEDNEEYFRRLRAEIQEANQQFEIVQASFINAADNAAILQALRDIPYIQDPNAVQKALGLLFNEQNDLEIRLLALVRTLTAITEDMDAIRNLLRILADTTEPEALRKSVFEQTNVLTFSSRAFIALKSEYVEILRGLLDDPSLELRAKATEQLAIYKDEFVQNRLLNGLRTQQTALVPSAKAIQLLAYDPHADYYPTVREILQNPDTDDDIKIEAIHALAFDQESKPLIANILNDRNQTNQVRMTSATAFQAAHPADFIGLAKPLVLDDSEASEVRAASLNALMHFRDADKVFSDEEFVNNVRNIGAPSAFARSIGNDDLKKMSERYIQKADMFLNKR
jgi:HEAT repeat protein